MTNIKLSPRETKRLRELFQGELESFLELSTEERNDPYEQREYAETYALAKKLDALPGKTTLFKCGEITELDRFPETLSASAEEVRKEEQRRKSRPSRVPEWIMNAARIQMERDAAGNESPV
jgi:hypothetical protein